MISKLEGTVNIFLQNETGRPHIDFNSRINISDYFIKKDPNLVKNNNLQDIAFPFTSLPTKCKNLYYVTYKHRCSFYYLQRIVDSKQTKCNSSLEGAEDNLLINEKSA